VLCKHEVVGSIPSGSTNSLRAQRGFGSRATPVSMSEESTVSARSKRRGFLDIVKRRYACWRGLPRHLRAFRAARRGVWRGWGRASGYGAGCILMKSGLSKQC
jgi:hypothetical protein